MGSGPFQATQIFRRALESTPRNERVLHALGIQALNLGMPESAVELFESAVAGSPSTPVYHKDLGLACRAAGRIKKALEHFHAAVTLDASDAESFFHLGATLPKPQYLPEALSCFQAAARLRPGCAEFQFNLGRAFQDSGRMAEAVTSYQAALRAKPGFRPALLNLAMALKEEGQLSAAAMVCTESLIHQTQDPAAQNTIGLILKARGDLDGAMGYFQKAIQISADYADARLNLSVTLREMGRINESFDAAREILRLDPRNPEAHWNLAFLLLLTGQYSEGWREYEWRWKLAQFRGRARDHGQPLWDGTPLHGGSIFLYTEQGFGDTLQFIRYAPLVKSHADTRVIVECPPSLKRLFEGLPGIDQLISRGDPVPDFDVQAPIMSLPGIFSGLGAEIPSQVPYLKPPRDLPPIVHRTGKFNVGLAWAGNSNHLNDANRSIPLSMMAPLLRTPGPEFHSLQMGPQAAELSQVAQVARIVDLAPRLSDFAHTAAAISEMDLVISVDTAVAHLAGAMGKPVWLLLPAAPDWRWLLDRKDTPWYPTMQLYRQDAPGDWSEVLLRAASALGKLCPHSP